MNYVDLTLPGLHSKGYDCFTIDPAPVSKAVGTQEDGILGYNFFARFVVTVNFEDKRMTLRSPAAFHKHAGFAPIDDRFFIDSGSSDAVDHPVVNTIQDRKKKDRVGLGTLVEGAIAVASSFRIGSFTVIGPMVACCGATEDTSRMMRTEVLRRFRVIFDYSSSPLS